MATDDLIGALDLCRSCGIHAVSVLVMGSRAVLPSPGGDGVVIADEASVAGDATERRLW